MVWEDSRDISREADSTYWLRMMFVQERGDDLWLGAAVPRYWLADGKKCGIAKARTYFGPMSVVFESRAAEGRIQMTIDPPRRNPPKRILARFRHSDPSVCQGKLPGRMTRCEVNGKPYMRFDPIKGLVVLTECVKPTRIIAYYDSP